jgi:hypothetical protein
MSEPTSPPRGRRPTRAEPLQPDLPGRGQKREKTKAVDDKGESARQRREQSDTALKNVREGYD